MEHTRWRIVVSVLIRLSSSRDISSRTDEGLSRKSDCSRFFATLLVLAAEIIEHPAAAWRVLISRTCPFGLLRDIRYGRAFYSLHPKWSKIYFVAIIPIRLSLSVTMYLMLWWSVIWPRGAGMHSFTRVQNIKNILDIVASLTQRLFSLITTRQILDE